MVLFATAGLPSAAVAQYRLPTIVSSVKADSLHEIAAKMVSDGRWGEAARVYRQSAEFRAMEDSIGYQCLTSAAALAYASGDRSAARSDMAHAAERALARGDLRAAAAVLSRCCLDRAGAAEAESGLGTGSSGPENPGGFAAPQPVGSRRDSSADRAGPGGKSAAGYRAVRRAGGRAVGRSGGR